MPRLHTGGRFRRRLGRAVGGDFETGDRLWRRLLHGAGAFGVVYLFLPDDAFVIAPKRDVLFAALAAVLVLEALRHLAGVELPTVRAYEARRVASFAFYAIALTVALVVFPVPLAAMAVVGVAVVDPLAGECRGSVRFGRLYPALPLLVYAAIAVVALAGLGRSPWPIAVGLGVLAAAIAVAVERPKYRWVDDDLAMTLVPAVALWLIATVVPGVTI